MNILDKQSPNAAGSTNTSSAPPSSGSMTPSSGDCLIPNSQLIPSLAVPSSSTAPSSVSSSSAPHTPIDTLNPVNCQSDLTANGLASRPNVSTPSSVFNSSAPNTPMPCPSVGSDANITSPALNQMDYGDQKMFNSGPPPQPLANNSSANNPGLLPSPLNVPPPMCNETKAKGISNGNMGNKKHCNNRSQNNFVNMNVNNDRANTCENNVTKSQMNFSNSSNMPNMPMPPCMPNGPQHNGNISPFDPEGKMGSFTNEFSSLPEGMSPQMPNMPITRPPNCSVGMNMQMQPNMMNSGPTKMCGNNVKTPMDAQYMQHQSQIFVFNTVMANQAAEAVDSGQFSSIIDFHLGNPLTKKFLDKHSLKIQNFNRPNMWIGNIRHSRMRGPHPNGLGLRANFNNPSLSPYNHNPPGPGPGGGPQWNPNNNWQNQGYHTNDMKMNCGIRQFGPQFNNCNNGVPSYPIGGNDMQDDNLTPQQKQHREKQLAILANLQQKFCPELMESNNRLTASQSNDFSNVDQLTPNNSNHVMFPDHMQIKSENDHLNQGMPSDPSLNFNSNFPPNQMMNNHPGNDQWLKSSNFGDEKQFNGRRKGSQGGNQQNLSHQSPLSQQSVNSPGSCLNQSPGNRVPPPPYNQGIRSISSPHPSSPAASFSLPSPRMQAAPDARQSNYTPGSVRSGPSTPSADNSNCALINNSPKSAQNSNANRSSNSNSSPGNKKNKSSIDDINILNSFSTKSEPALMPVPSPKQIDYINTFEGQELTIQKQPNAHFQDNDLMGSNELSINNDLFPNDFGNMCPNVNNPTGMPDMNQNSRFPITSQPCNFDSNLRFPSHENIRFNGAPIDGFRPPNPCAAQFNQNDANMRFPNCDNSMKQRMSSPNDIGTFSSPNSINEINYNNSIPPMINESSSFPNGPNNNFNDPNDNSMSSTHLQSLQKMAPPFDMPNKDGMIPNTKSMGPNMMNSNNNSMMPPNSMHPNIPQNMNQRMPNFDQSFPNMPCNDVNEPNNFPGQNMHQSNMAMNYPNNFGNPPRMPSNMPNDPQFANGPNSMIPQGSQGNFRFAPNMNRPMNPPNTHGPRYNSPNIQVKPDAPNTIQYLPSRPQGPTSTPPNRTPNLDFLQQSLNMGNKPPNNVPYFPNNPGVPMPNRALQNPNMSFSRPPMMRPQGSHMGNPQVMGHPGNEMFNRPCGPNIVNGPNNMPMNSNNFPPPPPGSVPNKNNSGPVIHPDSTPTSFNFKQSSFNLPNTSDPNYAAQFHNFQQQLYATNTRNSNVASNPRMSSNF